MKRLKLSHTNDEIRESVDRYHPYYSRDSILPSPSPSPSPSPFTQLSTPTLQPSLASHSTRVGTVSPARSFTLESTVHHTLHLNPPSSPAYLTFNQSHTLRHHGYTATRQQTSHLAAAEALGSPLTSISMGAWDRVGESAGPVGEDDHLQSTLQDIADLENGDAGLQALPPHYFHRVQPLLTPTLSAS
ncbi:hypothetical protein H4R35_005724, partial [Dimargaris xerosporica]